MSDEEQEPHIVDDELYASTDVHELLRYTRADETRLYHLRVVPGGAELWRITESPDTESESIKECDFQDSDQVSRFLEEVRRSLIAGGWREA